MLSGLLAAALALGSSALASPLYNTSATVGRGCASTPSSDFIAKAEAHFAEHRVTPAPAASKTIQVYYHVIYKDTSCVSP